MSVPDERAHRPASDTAAGSRRELPRPSSDSPRLEAMVDRVAAIVGRMTRIWRALPSERRLAAAAAIGLFATLFLPWYQETVIARGVTSLRSLSDSLTGWGAFSFVEAAVLLVAAGVLLLLFVRAEGEAFHVPGGDGGVITVAGAWACVLIIWRMFDKEGTTGHGLYTTSSGIEWGIFVALAVAGLLAYTGTRIRLAHEPEPPLPGERPRRRRLLRRRGNRTDSVASRPRSAPVEQQDWAAADEIEEMWLELERDRPPSRAPLPSGDATVPLPSGDAKAPLPPLDATVALPPPDATVPLPAADATAPPAPPDATVPHAAPDATLPLPPPDAAPAPRRRPRSLAEPAVPSQKDQATARLDRRN
jgi:hypothetical protein